MSFCLPIEYSYIKGMAVASKKSLKDSTCFCGANWLSIEATGIPLMYWTSGECFLALPILYFA